MKRLMSFILCLLCAVSIQANPNAPMLGTVKSGGITMPGYCEVEVSNYTNAPAYMDVIYRDYPRVNGIYIPPHSDYYLSLDYYGYCHTSVGMNLYDAYGQLIYMTEAYVNDWIDIDYGLKNKLAVKRK